VWFLVNLGRGMSESVVRKGVNNEHSCPGSHAAAIRPSRAGPRQEEPSHLRFIVSVAGGPEVSKVRSLTELCGLRVSVESYVAPKDRLQCKRCQRSYTRRVTAATCPGASRVGALNSPGGALRHGTSLSAVAAEETTRRTTGAVLSGKRRGLPL
jgi:hypothetical protein